MPRHRGRGGGGEPEVETTRLRPADDLDRSTHAARNDRRRQDGRQYGSAAPPSGASGAGHFVAMVDNGIEYGMMAAYADGLNLLLRAAAAALGSRTESDGASKDPT